MVESVFSSSSMSRTRTGGDAAGVVGGDVTAEEGNTGQAALFVPSAVAGAD
jgi:hypothetical protein